MTSKASRSARKPARRPTPRQHISSWDEQNVGRLGLVSIQERIPETFDHWQIDFTINGRPARLTCDALSKYGGVPHGLDGDVANAIIDMFIENGAPEDGVVHTTAYQVLKRAQLDTSGRYYKSLKSALFRLRTATYSASEAWYDARRQWTTVTFNYFSELEFTSDYASDEDDLDLTSASVLRIRLAEPIVRSIRAKHLKPLDREFIASLERPLTRALFRLLDARRYPPDARDTPLSQFATPLVAWAEACKIVDLRTNKIRETLANAHDDLTQRGYLKEVRYDGRGRKQTITYVFQDDLPQQTVEAVELSDATLALTTRGVSTTVARQLTETFGKTHVFERIEKFKALQASGYHMRNPVAILVDVVRSDADKYTPPGYVEPSVRAGRERQTLERPAPTPPEPPALPEDPEERASNAIRTVQFLMRDRLTTSEYAALRLAMLDGTLDTLVVVQQVTLASVERRLDAFSDELRQAVHGAVS
ncbi:replication initiator protein A [Deinococcus yavapaiensis]|uniref:Plasmid replication initiation protein n=1 Tax=Deinococcus yavapaiensis KR-236 TaxID=694435 RepID=A0A318S8E2_9DEIO|nr:replication initiator protein A [Deinococcus yavapaiensis]PYE52051.1 plasmid replication initiation protein [Deinococcus yavapaiensis KR-236]